MRSSYVPSAACALTSAGARTSARIARTLKAFIAAQCSAPGFRAHYLLMATVLACPVCGGALTLGASAAVCAQAHSFDRSRNGYFNLLLAKQSAEPGDSAQMLQSRRAFLHAGFYNQMSQATNAAVVQIVAPRSHAHVADLGCGEGFFTARLKRALVEAKPASAPVVYGVD